MLECETDIAELNTEDIDNLSCIASSLDSATTDLDNVLANYCDELHHLCDPITSPHYKVLQGLCSILFEGINCIAIESRTLTEDECKFLKKIPSILSEYVFIPTSRIPDAHLLSHFKNPKWPRPITEEEEKAFLNALMNDDVDTSINNDVDTNEETDENLDSMEIDLSSFMDSSADITRDLELQVVESEVINFSNDSPEIDCEMAVDVLDLSEFISESSHSSATTEQNGVDVSMEMSSSEECLEEGASDETCIIDLNDFGVEQDHTDDISADVIDLSSLDVDAHSEPEQINSTADIPSSDNAITARVEITDDQQELIDLVSLELNEIQADNNLTCIDTSSDPDAIRAQLIDIAEQVENISNAVELIDLQGLGHAFRAVSSNIHQMALAGKSVSEEQKNLIQDWPILILSYLQNIADAGVSGNILNYIRNSAWPEPVKEKSARTILELMTSPEFREEEKVERQHTANAEDVSLQLPEDVNQELLDGLLQDLPVQAEEFSSAIQNLLEKHDIAYLEVAQRIAHTLKGAGNVVGVKGIANLTHHLEDILELQSKAQKVPSTSLMNVLTDAADCLETMSEALMGIDEPPDNAVPVFQSILDWANKLDIDGATEYDPQDAPELDMSVAADNMAGNKSDTQPVSQTEHPAESSRHVSTAENTLRVPVKLADDLLRIAGENLISTSQIQEFIKTIQGRYKNLKSHNQSLQQLSFDLEHIVDVQGVANNNTRQVDDENDFDPLELDQYHELHSMSRRLVEIAADSIELSQVLEKDLVQLHGLVITQDQLQKENEELVLRTRMVSTRTIIARLKRGVKQACRLTGKQVELDVVDNDTYMDSEVLNSMIEPLMHILRNSVDHGIEEAEERKRSGKKIRGHISLVFSRRGDQIVITVQDDGRGLNLAKIGEKAVLTGLAATQSEVTSSNIQKYILHPGFSTRDEVSHVSGRGIGLDVVNNKIRELKGSIDIQSEEGKGCRFSLALPVSSFSTHSLLVRVRDVVYAFSNRGVEEILYPGLGELQQVAQETMFKVGDKLYPTMMIESLLNLPEDRRDRERDTRPIVLVRDDAGTTTAVMVQDVIDSRDVVVKSMGPYIPKIPGIVGATVLGDGSIAPVLDVPELLHSVSRLGRHVITESAELDMHTTSRLPYVLVVDDSLSARKSLAQFVQDLGLDVRTARDGMEAVSLIDARKPDLILVDMEMPRMNGLELTSHIRASANTQDMPVIMITSRSTDKHRKTAMDKGVDHYMVKPFAEEELASHINVALKIA